MQRLRLNCTACNDFTEYRTRGDDPDTVVRCADCGKRHNKDSVWLIDPSDSFERDESGTLLETPI